MFLAHSNLRALGKGLALEAECRAERGDQLCRLVHLTAAWSLCVGLLNVLPQLPVNPRVLACLPPAGHPAPQGQDPERGEGDRHRRGEFSVPISARKSIHTHKHMPCSLQATSGRTWIPCLGIWSNLLVPNHPVRHAYCAAVASAWAGPTRTSLASQQPPSVAHGLA